MDTIKRQDLRNTGGGQYYEETTFEGCELSGMSLDGMAFEDCIVPASCFLNKTIFSEENLRGLVGHLNIVIK